jgi:hypothetical protein
MDSVTEQVSAARRSRKLYVAPAVGLTVGPAPVATAVRANTFFGSDDR